MEEVPVLEQEAVTPFGALGVVGSATVEQLCLLDASGVVVSASEQSGATGLVNGRHLVLSVGFDYRGFLAACAPDDPYAAAALSALDGVLDGRSPAAVVDYPCHASGGFHWWRMQVVSLRSGSAVAAVTHQDVSALRQGALELAASDEIGLATGPTFVGTWDWSSDTDELRFSPHLGVMFGVDPDRPYTWQQWLEWIVEEDRDRVLAAARASAYDGAAFEEEYRIVPPSGELRTVLVRAQTLRQPGSETVRMVGAVVDVTTARTLQEELVRSLESMPSAFVTLDEQWRFTYLNSAAEILFERPRWELLGGDVWALYPDLVGSSFFRSAHEALESSSPVSFDMSFGSASRCFAVTAHSTGSGISLHFTDVTARREAEAERARLLESERRARAEAERVSARLSFLGALSSGLSVRTSKLDVLRCLAESALGVLGDWVVVYVPEDGTLVRVVARHVDPQLDEFAATLVDAPPIPLSATTFATQVYRSREPVLVDELSEEVLSRIPGGAYQRALRLMGDASGMVVPLVSRDETVAVLVTGFQDHRVSGEDLELAVAAAARAAAAFDAATLVEQQLEVARTLSRALLPADLPAPRGWVVNATYHPGTEGLEVGGDFYDAFEVQPGRLCLVVGDVSGHGLHSATVMGQVRNAIRAFALTPDAAPSDILVATHRLLERFEREELTTAVVAHLDLATGELVYASAGHLPFLIVVDGAATLVQLDPTLPLGVPMADVSLEGSDLVTHVPPGGRVVMYTDGLVERRDADLDTGITRLMLACERAYSLPLAEARARVFEELVGGGHADDVCTLAVERLRPPAG